MVSFRSIKCPLFPKPVSCPGLFFRFLQQECSNFYPVFLGCGENIDPQKEVTEETLTPQKEAKEGKVQLKKTVLMPNLNYSEISKVNSGKFFSSLYTTGKVK